MKEVPLKLVNIISLLEKKSHKFGLLEYYTRYLKLKWAPSFLHITEPLSMQIIYFGSESKTTKVLEWK